MTIKKGREDTTFIFKSNFECAPLAVHPAQLNQASS